MSDKMGRLFDHKPEVGSYLTTKALVLSRARVGIEIEVDRVKGGAARLQAIVQKDERDPASLWDVVTEGSVHNQGAEMKFSRPLFGQDVIDALDYFYTLQQEQGFKYGEETGIHVHLDVRNMDYDSFKRLCLLYGLVEPLLFKWISADREYNIFCEPWYRAQGDLKRISSILFGNKEAKLEAAHGLQRYSALNLAALHRFGSVEFRHLPTTFNKATLINWLNIILSLKRAATHMKENDYDILLRLSGEGPERMFGQIFSRKSVHKLLLDKGYIKEIEIGCLTVQDLINAHTHAHVLKVTKHEQWGEGDWLAVNTKQQARAKAHPGYIKAKKDKPKPKRKTKKKEASVIPPDQEARIVPDLEDFLERL